MIGQGYRRRQSGVAALVVALSLPLLIGLCGLVLDLGRLYVIKSEVQNAMDACALAASAPLTGVDDPRIFDLGRAHALALMDPGASGNGPRSSRSVNRLNFQHENFRLEALEVSFSQRVDGPFVAASRLDPQGLPASAARYARCRYTDPARPLWLLQALQAFGIPLAAAAPVSASAVATLAPVQSACTLPMAVCIKPGTNATELYGLSIGQRLSAVESPGSGYGPGAFGWVQFNGAGNGASGVRKLLEGSGYCEVAVGQLVGQPGQMSAISKSWNTRFGLYAADTSATQSPPDYSGYGYSGTSQNYAPYATQRALRSAFQGAVPGGTTRLSSAQHASGGQQRRVVIAPVVDCGPWNTGKTAGSSGSSSTVPIIDLACVLMLAPIKVNSAGGKSADPDPGWSETFDIELLGLLNQGGTPCASQGLVGNGNGRAVPGLVQ